MDEIVKEIVLKTGLPEAQAREVAQTVVNSIKQRLPAALAAQVDGFLNSQQSDDIAKQLFDNLLG